MLFFDAINSGQLHKEIQAALNDLNRACKKYPNSPRDAGVRNPSKIAKDPVRVVKVDLEDRDTGWVEILGSGLSSPVRVDFSADEEIGDWVNDTLLDRIPS